MFVEVTVKSVIGKMGNPLILNRVKALVKKQSLYCNFFILQNVGYIHVEQNEPVFLQSLQTY